MKELQAGMLRWLDQQRPEIESVRHMVCRGMTRAVEVMQDYPPVTLRSELREWYVCWRACQCEEGWDAHTGLWRHQGMPQTDATRKVLRVWREVMNEAVNEATGLAAMRRARRQDEEAALFRGVAG